MSGASGYVLVEDREVLEGDECVELHVCSTLATVFDRQPCQRLMP